MTSILQKVLDIPSVVSHLLEVDIKDITNCKILGQEQNGEFILCWNLSGQGGSCTAVGLFFYTIKKIQVLIKFKHLVNIVQASINYKNSILGYVTKESFEDCMEYYRVFIIHLEYPDFDPVDLNVNNRRQTMIQFLYRKRKQPDNDRFLVFIHETSITLYQVEETDIVKNHLNIKKQDQVVNQFSWAQWEPQYQCLFYIHYSNMANSNSDEASLSALQFHDEPQHETVLNVPLNLPNRKRTAENLSNGYFDIPVPLCVHDSMLDVRVLSDARGFVAVCHYYLYQGVSAPLANDHLRTVYLAFSVTLLHHGSVVHCNIAGVPMVRAYESRPIFTMQGDQHLLVHFPNMCTLLLDVGPDHEPNCHIVIPCADENRNWKSTIATTIGSAGTVIDLSTMAVFETKITKRHLIEAFKQPNAVLTNQQAILHYFIVHRRDMDIVNQLLNSVVDNGLNINCSKLLQEILVGSAFAQVKRSLLSDAVSLARYLPITISKHNIPLEVKVNGYTLSLSQEMLENPRVMLLSPRQRLIPFRDDLWTRLWELLPGGSFVEDNATSRQEIPRFSNTTVAVKLNVSLVCYQPEVLSRCSTPLSPGGSMLANSIANIAISDLSHSFHSTSVQLPFIETDTSAASKQEHVISVNLRELSMHLLKQSSMRSNKLRNRSMSEPNAMHVHAVATKYASSQLEISRSLCAHLTLAAGVDTRLHKQIGFQLIDNIEDEQRQSLLTVLQRLIHAADTLAFPLPQGFPSFITYLGYKVMSATMFSQYVRCNTFLLNVDVMKKILADITDNKDGVLKKLDLLQSLPHSRAKRLMNQWSHPISVMLRAREHAAEILGGMSIRAPNYRRNVKYRSNSGVTSAFPSHHRMSPLETFLELLTAKAMLADIDYNLLVDATVTSTKENMFN
ncbi:protein pigeon isoform X1 [Melanaphis sacchari]|uniref:protein pigeon isoform X1 n=1 Tax=Melanaphis sacchari TaxID=742174 RepID=UPI000DC14F69|nr:protein pigeon isoform X1 [Melanaphis sacchari]XP_025207383.1 protein pigeon isoform X1 [Melanaphis sacchari]